jgi:hypothetical protein
MGIEGYARHPGGLRCYCYHYQFGAMHTHTSELDSISSWREMLETSIFSSYHVLHLRYILPDLIGNICNTLTTRHLGIFIVSDIIFSLLPLTFIWTIRRQLVEKVVLAFLMSLGISASAAAMIKITKFKQYDVMTDPSWSLAQMGMWGWLEVHIGIIAASLPCLNGPFQRGMRRLGLTSPMTSHGSGTANFPAGARSAGNGDVFLKSPSTTVNGGESVAVIDEERLLAEERGEIIKMLIKTEELN